MNYTSDRNEEKIFRKKWIFRNRVALILYGDYRYLWYEGLRAKGYMQTLRGQALLTEQICGIEFYMRMKIHQESGELPF